jgi:hypothetical protein
VTPYPHSKRSYLYGAGTLSRDSSAGRCCGLPGTKRLAGHSYHARGPTGSRAGVLTPPDPSRREIDLSIIHSFKKAADDLKASVAVKDDYARANDVYKWALKEKDAGDIENASKDFTDCRDRFDAVTKVAQQKKNAAVQALQSAQQDRAASQQKAEDADKALKDESFTVGVSGL